MPEPRAIESQQQVGQHHIDIEGDKVVCRYQGALSLSEVEAVHKIIEAALQKHGHCYQLIDMKQLETPDYQVRRWISQWAQRHTLEAVLCFNATSGLHVITGLLTRAIYFLRKDKRPTVLFLRTEEEARAIAAEMYTRRQALPSGRAPQQS